MEGWKVGAMANVYTCLLQRLLVSVLFVVCSESYLFCMSFEVRKGNVKNQQNCPHISSRVAFGVAFYESSPSRCRLFKEPLVGWKPCDLCLQSTFLRYMSGRYQSPADLDMPLSVYALTTPHHGAPVTCTVHKAAPRRVLEASGSRLVDIERYGICL